MEISEFALRRLIQSARIALKMEDVLQELLEESHDCTIADQCCGYLLDALHDLSGEHLPFDKRFEDLEFVQLLNSDKGDSEATEEFIRICKRHHFSQSTPEGEWT